MRLHQPGTDRQIAFIEAFDPKAAEKRATITLDALIASVTAQGGSPPELGVDEESGSAVAVMSDAGGLFLSQMSGPPLWVRDRKVTPMTVGADGASLTVTSAVETKPEELAVLALDSDGTAHVRRLAKGVAEELFSIPSPPDGLLPASPDALGVAPDGSLVVLRIPSASPPSTESPAFLLGPKHEPVALAPWSTLLPADAPACADGKGVRAIVAAKRAWVAIEAGQPDEEHVMLARVRWSEERVCLEAIEVGGLPHDLPTGSMESYFVARFGKDAGGGHVMVGPGAELREPRTCALRPAPP
jgi:hypothetical protein